MSSDGSYGTIGRRQKVISNYIEFPKCPTGEIYQYDVEIKPERGEFKRLPPPEYMRSVFDSAMRTHRQGKLKGIPMVYDARKVAYAPKPVCEPKETLELEVSNVDLFLCGGDNNKEDIGVINMEMFHLGFYY